MPKFDNSDKLFNDIKGFGDPGWINRPLISLGFLVSNLPIAPVPFQWVTRSAVKPKGEAMTDTSTPVSAEAPAPHHPLEMAICMGMDAMRLCLGMPTRNYTRDEIEAWMDAMAETETKP